MHDQSDTDVANGDGEGVWSPDIEKVFHEALDKFPACGRRKHILQEEGGGKMYGRNELIARFIFQETGKIRTRKQVSSHIQVLARRKAKSEASVGGSGGGGSATGSTSPASSISTSTGPDSTSAINYHQQLASSHAVLSQQSHPSPTIFYDVWNDRPIVTQKIRLVEFSAFIEHRRVNSSQFAREPHGTQLLPGIAPQLVSFDAANTTTTKPATGDSVTSPFERISNSGMIATSYSNPNSQIHNNHSPAQSNRADNFQIACQLQSHQQQHFLNLNHRNQETHFSNATNFSSHYLSQQQHQSQLASTSFDRHSYVKIDYRHPLGRQTNKLERIDISLIQDKFPEISGQDGLFQKGPPDAFFLVKFWADLNNNLESNFQDLNSFFGFSSQFETIESYKNITCSTKACSYGLQVVEKVEKIYGAFNSLNGRYSYDITRSPMCEFMAQFIKKLRQLPRTTQMNSVLENFSVLQVITSETTSEILLCLAYVFEIASPGHKHGSKHHVYKLMKY